mgnify:CR=1 FL=1
MAWLEMTLNTPQGSVNALVTELTALGFEDLCIEDQQEFESFLEENREYWDYIDESLEKQLQGLSRVKLYLEDTDAGNLKKLRAFAEKKGLPLEEKALPDTDWSESWKENYPPQEVGQSLVVLPYWLSEDYRGDRKMVVLDPGLTFGTGAHPSTQMVMEAMEQTVTTGMHCLDLGSGSGILSIVALLLGAKDAFACDIDDKCVGVAYENAALNGVGREHYTVRAGDVLSDKGLQKEFGGDYDVIVANIVADVIIALAPQVGRLLKKGGIFLCSGIIDDRADEVREKLVEAGWQIEETRSSEGWFSYLCR